MSKNKKGRSEKKFIDELIQASFGMDQDGNLKEYYDAKGHLNDFPRLQASSNEFDLIVDRIELLNITPQIERRAPVRYHLVMRPVLVAAILIAAVLGLGIVASATKYHVYRGRVVEADNDNVVWNNDDNLIDAGTEREIYDIISERLGIRVLRMTYIPFDMIFSELEIKKGHATLKYIYEDRRIYLKETKLDVNNSDNHVSDNKNTMSVYNEWIQKSITISTNMLDNGLTEYSAELVAQGAHYHLHGVIEEEEFIQLVKGLNFYN